MVTAEANRILAKVLAMDDAQLAKFMSGLSPDLLTHLDILLAKAENATPTLKKYLDKK